MPGVVYQIDLINPLQQHPFNAYAEIQLKSPDLVPITHPTYSPASALVTMELQRTAMFMTPGSGALTVLTPPVFPVDAMQPAGCWYEIRVFTDGVMSQASSMAPIPYPRGGKHVASYRVTPTLAQEVAGLPISLASPLNSGAPNPTVMVLTPLSTGSVGVGPCRSC